MKLRRKIDYENEHISESMFFDDNFLFAFVGCNKTLKITDFEGLENLCQNPVKIVFETNAKNFDEEKDVYGETIEYEISSSRYTEITEKLFAISYKALDKYTLIDLYPIINILTFSDINGTEWTIHLGLRHHNTRWYSPINEEPLIELLNELIIEK